MKTNKKHIIIPALMMAVGVGLVGSISGTVAWYQYSTRVQAAYIGTSAKATENLQIKASSMDGTVNSGYKQDLLSTDVATVLDAAGTENDYGTALAPITTGKQAKDAALAAFKGNPIYQYAATSSWADATKANYVQFKLSFRVQDIDGTGTSYLQKKVYLTDLTIMDNAANSTLDLSDAVRVHIAGSGVNALFSKSGADTAVYGPLDLNNDNKYDLEPGYEWDDPAPDQIVYGDEDEVQAAYKANDNTIQADDTDATLVPGTALCTTATDGSDVSITVTIWLEGWQKLDHAPTGNKDSTAAESAVWDPATYIGKKFNVGMRFAVQPVGVAD